MTPSPAAMRLILTEARTALRGSHLHGPLSPYPTDPYSTASQPYPVGDLAAALPAAGTGSATT